MGPILLHLRTKTDALAALDHLRSRVLQPTDVRTIILREPTALPRSESVDEGLLADILAECTNLHRLDLDRWTFESLSAASIQRAAAGALSSVKELVIGPRGSLCSDSFFLLLSAMPALRFLELNSIIDSDCGSDDEPVSFPAPACKLTSVVVSDDWGIDFKHYALLLRHSHDTLEHLELHWVFDADSEVGPLLADALAPCRNLRSLVLIGNQFDCADAISKCPRLRCLTLLNPPIKGDLAALQAPLRELRLVHCTPLRPPRRPTLASLQTISLFYGPSSTHSASVQFNESFHQLRMLCAEQHL